MIVLPGAEPYAADRGPVGVVLSHGFTATTRSMRPWAESLAAAGYTVRLPRLPGHGTTWQDANTTRWQDWYGEVRQAYEQLQARCDTIFAGGLSMGGTLVTRLAEEEGNRLAGTGQRHQGAARGHARLRPHPGARVRIPAAAVACRAR